MSKLFILDALKAHLKARDLTYRDLATGLNLSEVSIKRLFANADCSLARLEEICTYLQIEFSDLFKSSPKKKKLISCLTHHQELEFVNNKQLLTVAVCALSHWPVHEILDNLNITRQQASKLLKRLTEIGFLELITADQYKLLVSTNFSWITNGPIMRMVQGISDDYFNNHFDGEGEILRIINIRISKEAQVQLRNRLEKIAQEYVDQSRADSHLPLSERPPVSLCIAARTWIPQFMKDIVRLPEKKSRF